MTQEKTPLRTHLLLFLATVVSVFVTSLGDEGGLLSRASLLRAAEFTGTLIAILLAHELGHYIAARLHGVAASLPYFIPMPIFSPFGTMGAVIRMKDRIERRRALLDIGAAGPLLGLVVAIPMYIWGIRHSTVVTASELSGGTIHLGESLLSRFLDKSFGPVVPEGGDLLLSPAAFAAWAGMFVTMINLLPVGQLDAGHVAYALFGVRQNQIAGWVHRAVLVFFVVSVLGALQRDVRDGLGLAHLSERLSSALFWFVWFEVLAMLGTFGKRSQATGSPGELGVRPRIVAVVGLLLLAQLGQGYRGIFLWVAWLFGFLVLLVMEFRFGALRDTGHLSHPPTNDEPLGVVRTVVAVVTLAFFVLLFMPVPMSM